MYSHQNSLWFVFEIRKIVNLKTFLGLSNTFLKSRFVCSAQFCLKKLNSTHLVLQTEFQVLQSSSCYLLFQPHLLEPKNSANLFIKNVHVYIDRTKVKAAKY